MSDCPLSIEMGSQMKYLTQKKLPPLYVMGSEMHIYSYWSQSPSYNENS